MSRFFALTIPVPVWFALLMAILMLGMNWCVHEQLRLVRWFYDNRPAPLPDDTDDERCVCGHEWGLHLGAKLNHACAAERSVTLMRERGWLPVKEGQDNG